jgi:hypothetical protein
MSLVATYSLFYDWSHAPALCSLAFVACVAALRWPKTVVAAGALLVVMAALAHNYSLEEADLLWVREAAPGRSWAEVQRALGPATHEGSTLSEVRLAVTGYSEPSPLQYPGQCAVAVYIRGDLALWVFHDRQRVLDRYVGGS